MNLNKPPAGDTDWAGEINQNWTDLEKACTQGEGLTTIASTPPQLTANQNDYTFSGGSPAYIFQRLSADASRTITGIASGADGKHHSLANVGAYNIVLSNEDAASAAANRILTGTSGSITLAPDERVDLVYDATTQRWRCGAKVYAGTLSSGAVQSGHVASGAIQGSLGATRHIASGSVGPFDLGSGAILSGAIASGQIGGYHVASGQLTWDKLGSGAVLSGAIASGQIGKCHISSGLIGPLYSGISYISGAQTLSLTSWSVISGTFLNIATRGTRLVTWEACLCIERPGPGQFNTLFGIRVDGTDYCLTHIYQYYDLMYDNLRLVKRTMLNSGLHSGVAIYKDLGDAADCVLHSESGSPTTMEAIWWGDA